MALLADRVKETSTTTGTGVFTLAGAVTGFQSFASAFSDADQVFYVLVAVNASGVASGAWEVGIGTVGSSGTSLARNVSVYASSNAGALVNFGAGTKHVFVDRPAAGLLPIIVPNGSPLALNAALAEVLGLDANGHLLSGGAAGSAVLSYGQFATVTTNLGGANSNIRFTSRYVGAHANDLTIDYVDPMGNDAPFSLDIDYPTFGASTVTVNLATGPGGAITTIAQDIIDAFTTADGGGQKAVHTIAIAAGGDATGIVAAGSWTLAGGIDGNAQKASTLSTFTVAGPGSGSYAGDPYLLHLMPTSPETAWFGLDDGAGFYIDEEGEFSLVSGDGEGNRITTMTLKPGSSTLGGAEIDTATVQAQAVGGAVKLVIDVGTPELTVTEHLVSLGAGTNLSLAGGTVTDFRLAGSANVNMEVTSEGVYFNSIDNGSYLQLGSAGELTELSNSDGTSVFLGAGQVRISGTIENLTNALNDVPFLHGASFGGPVTATALVGPVLFPTSDPSIPGAWWNNAGTLVESV